MESENTSGKDNESGVEGNGEKALTNDEVKALQERITAIEEAGAKGEMLEDSQPGELKALKNKVRNAIKANIYAIAVRAGIDIDTEEFRAISQKETGQQHLDDMGEAQLNTMLGYVREATTEKGFKPGAVVDLDSTVSEAYQARRKALEEKMDALDKLFATFKQDEKPKEPTEEVGGVGIEQKTSITVEGTKIKWNLLEATEKIWKKIISPLLGFSLVGGFVALIAFGIYSAVMDKIKENYFENADEKIEIKDYQGAIEEYTKAIEFNDDNSGSYNRRGNAKWSLGDYQGALADYNKAVEINPHYYKAYRNMGNLKAELQDFRGAIADYSKAIEDEGYIEDDEDYYYRRGISRYNIQDYRGAIADFTYAIEKYPDYMTYSENRGLAFVKLNRLDSACLDFSQAAKGGSLMAFEAKKKYCQ